MSKRHKQQNNGKVPQGVTIVGAGNVGSQITPHAARLDPAFINLIDPDQYELRNLASQNISSADIGRFKVDVQAEAIGRIAPHIPIRKFPSLFQDVPLGAIRNSIIIGCVDSRASRFAINQVAGHLGLPLIDCGVDGSENVLRVNVYDGSEGCPCCECGWGPDDYAAMEQQYPCARSKKEPHRIAPSSGLGAWAAAIAATQCEAMLSGTNIGTNRIVFVDARTCTQVVTRLVRNPRCQFDHEHWTIADLGIDLYADSLESLIAKIRGTTPNDDFRLRLSVPGHSFARLHCCTGCGKSMRTLRLASRGNANACEACGKSMAAVAVTMIDQLVSTALTPTERKTSLIDLGLLDGDIVGVSGSEIVLHFELRHESNKPTARVQPVVSVASATAASRKSNGRERWTK